MKWIERRTVGRVQVVTVRGSGGPAEPSARDELLGAIESSRFAVIDLSRLDRIEWDDLQLLVGARKAHRARWGTHLHSLKLVARPGEIKRRLQLLQIDDVIPTYRSLDEALSAFPARRVVHLEPVAERADFVEVLLEGHGFEVVRVRSPRDLPPRAELGEVDFVLTEIDFGDGPDPDLIRRLRVDYAAPVGVLTCREVGPLDGAAFVAVERCRPELLVERIETALENPYREYYETILDLVPIAVLVVRSVQPGADGSGPAERTLANRGWIRTFRVDPGSSAVAAAYLPAGLEGREALADAIEATARLGGGRRMRLAWKTSGEPPRRLEFSLTGVAPVGSDRHRVHVVVTATELGAAPESPAPLEPAGEERLRDVLLSLLEDLDATSRDLAAANRRLQQLDRLKSEFVATVSHELKTPIASIIGSVENLLDGLVGDLSDAQRASLRVVCRNARRLARMIENLLDLSRIESGRMQLTTERIDLREPVRHAVEQIQPIGERQGIRRILELPASPVEVEVDADRVVQVVTNLLDNALRYARSEARVRVEAAGGTARLVVEDDGPGIPEGRAEAIFERFGPHRVGDERSHLGIGLSIVRSIAEAQGGTVRAENRAGKEGARFVVEWPADGGEGIERPGLERRLEEVS